jgi:quinol monooxygenase YgiN
MAYAVAVKWIAAEGSDDRVAEIAAALLAPTRAEPGCRYYQANRDPVDPRTFFFFEVYDDEAAFQSHRASEHIQRLALGEAVPLLESRELAAYETIDG